MPARQPLAQYYDVEHTAQLGDVLSPLVVKRLISGSQYAAIIRTAAAALPGDVTIEQRTPKGVTYVCANGRRFVVNARGKILSAD